MTKQSQREFAEELEAVTPRLLQRCEGRCEASIPGVCRGTTLYRHHRRSRRIRKDGKANSPSNVLMVCLSCHEWIHKHVAWSKQFGLIISTSSNPDQIPVSRDYEREG